MVLCGACMLFLHAICMHISVSTGHFTKALRTGRCHCTTGAVCKYELKYVLIISHRKCLGAAADIILVNISSHDSLLVNAAAPRDEPTEKNCLTLQFPPALWVSFSISRLVALALQVLN